MKLICTFENFIFNTGELFYQCIIKDQKIPQNDQFDISGQHLPKKYDPDVTFVEFRDCDCPKVPQGLTKIFPNLKVLGFDNSKLKELTKDDVAEYKGLQRFICNKNDIDFLPGNLFEGFVKLDYMKFTNNKFGVIEPSLLNFQNKLEYVNFKSNPDYHFIANGWIHNGRHPAQTGSIGVTLYSNFLNGDVKFIKNYVLKSTDPNDRLFDLSLYKFKSIKSKFNLLEVTYDLYEATRAKDIEMIKEENQDLEQKVDKMEALTEEIGDEVKKLEGFELSISSLIDECSRDLVNVKLDGLKMAKSLQSQIDNLFRQFQLVLSQKSQNKILKKF